MGAAVQDYLREVCRRLLEYDRDIVEIVQFGSSVYAPELSRDVDLLVVRARERGSSPGLSPGCAPSFPPETSVPG